MLRLIYVFLGCNLPMQLLLKLLSSNYDDRLEDRFNHVPIHVTSYEICNIIFMLEQVDLHVFLSVIYEYSYFFV